jgi:hypothetical protein
MPARDANGFVGLALASPEDERLFKASLESQGFSAGRVNADAEEFVATMAADPRTKGATAIVVDAAVLVAHRTTAPVFAQRLRQSRKDLEILVRLPSRSGIAPHERAWASNAGIASLLPGSSVAAWQDSLAPVIARIATTLDVDKIDTMSLEAVVGKMIKSGVEPRPGPVKDIYANAWRLESDGVNANAALEALHGARELVKDRRYHGKVYRECFIASEAIDWMVANLGMRRSTALATGAFLWRTGRIHHVLREAAFDDGLFYFRFGLSRSASSALDLTEVERAMRSSSGGLSIADRTYLGKTYAKSFVGNEAVDWLMKRYELSRGSAEGVGQSLLELGELHHVVDEHGFVDEGFFYRFRADESA